MAISATDFARDLEAAFDRQLQSPDGRGARVTHVRVCAQSSDDFGIEVTFQALPDGPSQVDVLDGVMSFVQHLPSSSPDDLAAHWIQELDERVLSR